MVVENQDLKQRYECGCGGLGLLLCRAEQDGDGGGIYWSLMSGRGR